jgi:arginine decarboxylase
LKYWGNDNFYIDEGVVKLDYKSSPSLLNIVKCIRDDGHRGPLLLRFPHLIAKQIDTIYSEFNRAIKEFHYSGAFNAVFPLKVNQFPNFVKPVWKPEARRS